MKIIHEKSKCIGCGTCAAICPEFFEMDEKDNLAELKNSQIDEDGNEVLETKENKECLKEASEVCPVQIIHIS